MFDWVGRILMGRNDGIGIYEPPFRPPYEFTAAVVWAGAAALGLGWALAGSLPLAPALYVSGACAVLGGVRAWQGWGRKRARDRLLEGGGLWFMGEEKAREHWKNARSREELWLGEGFEWTPRVAEVAHNIYREGIDQVAGKVGRGKGAYWLHAVGEPGEVCIPLPMLDGNVIVVGATRAGKTRFLDHVISQAVMRGEPVIVIDPKGDHELREQMKRAYLRAGRPDAFRFFHPGLPEDSVCIDPMRNWNRRTELASRVAALIATEGGGDPFVAFSWRVLNNFVNGILMIHERPTLVQLRRLIEGGAESMLLKVLRAWCEHHAKPEEYAAYVRNARNQDKEINGYIRFYREVLSQRKGADSLDLEGLIADVQHDKEHFGKMVTSLTPIMTMLTSPPLDTLLSPRPDEAREVTDIGRVIRERQGLYVGLDSLSDTTVGSAIGAILLADMAAVAGDRYNYGVGNVPVNLLVDEAAEVANAQLVQVMNKGGGAKIRSMVLTQTLADFVARLGNEAKARQLIGNANTVISFRIQDGQTAEMLAESMPKIRVRQVEQKYSQGVGVASFQGGYGESLKEQDVELFPAAMYHQLPTLHYIARLGDGRIMKGRIPILV